MKLVCSVHQTYTLEISSFTSSAPTILMIKPCELCLSEAANRDGKTAQQTQEQTPPDTTSFINPDKRNPKDV